MLGASSLLPSPLAAQSCTSTITSVAQTTTLTGTGNNTFTPTFTQYFPPGGYTLVSAVLKSTITISASMLLTNSTGAAITGVKAGVNDEDVLQLNGADLTDEMGNDISDESTVTKNFAAVTVPANGSVTVGPQTLFNNVALINDSITTANVLLNSFLGTGSLALTYSNSTGYSINTSVNVTPTFAVTTQFSLTYYYCYTGILAADILTFTATRENQQTVALNWLTTNEMAGRKYIIQVSSGNGANFSNVDSVVASAVNSDASYAYNYSINSTDTGQLFFRLKMIDPTGNTAYSPMRVIDLDGGSASRFSIYPNPPGDFINLSFPDKGNWQIEIFAADGNLVQRNNFKDTNLVQIFFNRKMSAGAYFVRAVNPRTSRNYTGSFVID
jgi:Secretion system C-terminal sorting domain